MPAIGWASIHRLQCLMSGSGSRWTGSGFPERSTGVRPSGSVGHVWIFGAKGFPQPTIFEVDTALAYLYFLDQHCDLVITETGMGGALDATNVVEKPLCCVFASVGWITCRCWGVRWRRLRRRRPGLSRRGGRWFPPGRIRGEACLPMSRKKGAEIRFADPGKSRRFPVGGFAAAIMSSRRRWRNLSDPKQCPGPAYAAPFCATRDSDFRRGYVGRDSQGLLAGADGADLKPPGRCIWTALICRRRCS